MKPLRSKGKNNDIKRLSSLVFDRRPTFDYQVNGCGLSDLAASASQVSNAEIDALVKEYEAAASHNAGNRKTKALSPPVIDIHAERRIHGPTPPRCA